jgi:glycosyltransferase involved in cell wall biosynthesis
VSKSLTIVLPVYNAESRLRKNVTELLELASELTPKFGVLIVDDGSTDATFEIAGELAAHFPQVAVRRHRTRQGMGAAIEYAQRRVRTDAVIVHDGVTQVDAHQMRSVWLEWISNSPELSRSPMPLSSPNNGLREFSALSSIHAGMQRAHRRVLGFQLITCNPIDEADVPSQLTISRSDSPQRSGRSGVGQIPPLPRPKFLARVAAFAFGE